MGRVMVVFLEYFNFTVSQSYAECLYNISVDTIARKATHSVSQAKRQNTLYGIEMSMLFLVFRLRTIKVSLKERKQKYP